MSQNSDELSLQRAYSAAGQGPRLVHWPGRSPVRQGTGALHIYTQHSEYTLGNCAMWTRNFVFKQKLVIDLACVKLNKRLYHFF